MHVFQWPTDGKLIVGNLQSTPRRAYLLADPNRAPLKTGRLNDRDVEVAVPATAPDPTDTVVVLEMDGPVNGTKGRLLAMNVPENQLLAFDATAHGNFSYGDGKAARYHASGFAKAGDYLSWPIRLNAPAAFDVFARVSADTGTKLVVSAGNESVVAATPQGDLKTTSNQLVHLGRLSLPAGQQELRFNPQQPGKLLVYEVLLKPIR